ncbi:hypothetical protein [Phenylobacterium sp.]|uniref:hypothetical protein n=1 Tax=Phenylobacterium sp. TaxID=1871053 RepID=UPI001201CEF5|nr:hypothetical protein [Phenylobacterium sp.]THD62699.1 MAG: PepSY domain-containing protein [Phenylobacterium sp.]
MAKQKTARGNSALRLAFIRQIHVYISVFVAPSLLFFAFTGALQTFRIPDQKTTPAVIQKLARLHKDDVFAMKPLRPERPKAGGHDGADHAKAGAEKPAEPKPQARAATEATKWFFAAVSVGVIFSALFGLWMAITYNRRKAVVWIVLIAGAAVPAALALL